jgi:alkylation response protein AidB-like acyl-CoA dehydrogenase
MPTEVTTSAERQLLRETVRAFLERYSPEHEVRRAMSTDDGIDSALWRRMADELGLQGIAVPEEYGGTGYGMSEMQIVLEELGRSLACVPFLSSALVASNLILASGDVTACHDYLPELCSGSRIATVAVTEDGAGWDADNWRCYATVSCDRYQLSGRKSFVVDAHAADLFLVTAATLSGPAVFAVDAAADGVSAGALENVDATRRLGWVDLDAAEGRLVGTPGDGAVLVRHALVPAAAGLAAEQVGGARRALEVAVEYAKVREQFGRVIGSFQAIKQKCADMLLAVESATSAVYAAGLAIDDDSSESAALAYLALAQANEAYVFAATESIEIHGGVGFTWEHPAHLYYKRAVASSVLFGTAASLREWMLLELAR